MRAERHYVLVADATRARLFERTFPGPRLVAVWEDTSAAVSVNEPSDRPGRSFDRATPGRHAMEPPTDPVRLRKRRYASRVVNRLQATCAERRIEALTIAAPPQFLGELRQALPKEVASLVKTELAKDLSHEPVEDLARHLTDVL